MNIINVLGLSVLILFWFFNKKKKYECIEVLRVM